MTNTKLLEQAIQNSGLKKGYIAAQLGISRTGFRDLVTNRSEFKASQIEALCELLRIEPDQRSAIFFARSGG